MRHGRASKAQDPGPPMPRACRRIGIQTLFYIMIVIYYIYYARPSISKPRPFRIHAGCGRWRRRTVTPGDTAATGGSCGAQAEKKRGLPGVRGDGVEGPSTTSPRTLAVLPPGVWIGASDVRAGAAVVSGRLDRGQPPPPARTHRQASSRRGGCALPGSTRRCRLPGAVHPSMIATARVQPAEAPRILWGKQETMKPSDGRASRLCSFSRWQ